MILTGIHQRTQEGSMTNQMIWKRTHLFLKVLATTRAANAPFSFSWFISDDALNCESWAAGWLAGKKRPANKLIYLFGPIRIYLSRCIFHSFTSMDHIRLPSIVQVYGCFKCMTGSNSQGRTSNWNSSISFVIFTWAYWFQLKCLEVCRRFCFAIANLRFRCAIG